MTDAAVGALARVHGIETSYVDADGCGQRADPDVLVALMRALGVPIETASDARMLLEERRRAGDRRHLEPVLVHRAGLSGAEDATACIPTSAEPEDLWLTLELEDGFTQRARLSDALGGPIRRAPEPGPVDSAVVPLDFTRLAGGAVPAGRHRLVLEGLGAPEDALLIAAPRCPSSPRRLGAFMPVHALRTQDDWGVGSYTDLGRLAGWLLERGVDLLATLPLYPAFLEPPADPSPYMPVSRLAYNDVFIDPVALPEFAACRDAQERWAGPLAADIAALRSSTLVPYEAVARLLRAVLEPMSRCVCDGRLPGRRDALEAFAGDHPELLAYAVFRARREGADTEHDGSEVAFQLYCQWAACQQLRAATEHVALFADFPVGSHPQGFDPEWSPASFVPRVRGGAPPDRFFPGGQDWGFRPLHPERMREDGYTYLSAALGRAFRHAACVRLDHVMGLQRIFMIPEGEEGRGAYVEYHVEELHALVALEAHRSGCAVVGEDLGTVPPEVRPRLERDNILRTWVFQFESDQTRPMPDPPHGCLAALGTHDLPRFAAYLWGEDIEARAEAGVIDVVLAREEREARTVWRQRILEDLGVLPDSEPPDATAAALEGCLRHLARSAAPIVLVDLEEAWGERVPQNVPGTGPEAKNWRRRSAYSLEMMEKDVTVVTLLEALATERAT